MNQNQIICDCCKITYDDRWAEGNKCLFCIKFVPMADRKQDIMMQIEYHFMYGGTGEYSRASYYNKYLNYLNTWCIKWNIPSNTEDKEFEESLRKVNDWTREYWH